MRLHLCRRIDDNLAVVGPSGVGKSWPDCAIDHKACRDNRSVLYHRWPKLCEDVAPTRAASHKGNCWDNAVTETLFGSMKVERAPWNALCQPSSGQKRSDPLAWLL